MSGTHSDNKNGRLSTYIGGKKTDFKYNPKNPADKRRAEAERRAHDENVAAAIDARAVGNLGRPATQQEISQGLKLPNPLSKADQIRAQERGKVQGHGTVDRDPEHDVYRDRIAQLQADIENKPSRLHGPLLSRIAQLEKESAKFQKQLQARKEREAFMARPEVADCRVAADATIALLQASHDPASQAQLEAAIERRNRLNRDGDTNTFWDGHALWLAERATNLASKEVTLREQAAALEAEAASIRDRRKADPLESEVEVEQA